MDNRDCFLELKYSSVDGVQHCDITLAIDGEDCGLMTSGPLSAKKEVSNFNINAINQLREFALAMGTAIIENNKNNQCSAK